MKPPNRETPLLRQLEQTAASPQQQLQQLSSVRLLLQDPESEGPRNDDVTTLLPDVLVRTVRTRIDSSSLADPSLTALRSTLVTVVLPDEEEEENDRAIQKSMSAGDVIGLVFNIIKH